GKPKRIPIYLEKLSAAYSHMPAGMTADGGLKLKEKPALITQPLVHIGGMFWIVHSLLDARPVSLLDKFNVVQWANAVERYQIRVCSLVPAMINMVLESDLSSDKLESLICIRSGTAPLTVEAQKAFETRFGVPILTTYGATEFSGAVCGWTMDDKKQFGDSKAGSVGRAYQGVELQVVDPESGGVLAVDETGILQVRSDQMAQKRDWVATTDLASIDGDGFVWLSGRADAAINRGGFKILPTEVADILETNAHVKEAIVVGIDDARLGQVPVAAVELTDDANNVSEDSLKAWAKENMTSYFVPTRIAIVETLPRTPSMKVSQSDVKRLFDN
ncbi:MAG: fatty acid--CoA ligase family protein, partial [Pseudomonadota bacterium]